jgi:hypothetical protein
MQWRALRGRCRWCRAETRPPRRDRQSQWIWLPSETSRLAEPNQSCLVSESIVVVSWGMAWSVQSPSLGSSRMSHFRRGHRRRHGVLIFSTVNAVPDPGDECRPDRVLHYATPEGQREQEAERLDPSRRMDLCLAREPAPSLGARVTPGRRTSDRRRHRGEQSVSRRHRTA